MGLNHYSEVGGGTGGKLCIHLLPTEDSVIVYERLLPFYKQKEENPKTKEIFSTQTRKANWAFPTAAGLNLLWEQRQTNSTPTHFLNKYNQSTSLLQHTGENNLHSIPF